MKAVKTLPKPPRSLPESSRTAGPVCHSRCQISYRFTQAFGVWSEASPLLYWCTGELRWKAKDGHTQGRHQSFAVRQKQLLIGEPPKRKVCCRQGLRSTSTYRNRWPGRRLNRNGLLWGNAERYTAYSHKLKSCCASRLDAAPDISLRWSLDAWFSSPEASCTFLFQSAVQAHNPITRWNLGVIASAEREPGPAGTLLERAR